MSIGIQSWSADELRAMGRPQNVQQATTAVKRLRNSGIRSLNIDLIYGVEGQTEETMRANVTETLRTSPTKSFCIRFMYVPLLVWDATPVGRGTTFERALYRVGREALLDAGFRQTSMRRFERSSVTLSAGEAAGRHSYDCQRDPMIGLGPGPRSSTPNVTTPVTGRMGAMAFAQSSITTLPAMTASTSSRAMGLSSPTTIAGVGSCFRVCCTKLVWTHHVTRSNSDDRLPMISLS